MNSLKFSCLSVCFDVIFCINYYKKASSYHRGDAAALERSVPSGGGQRGESGSSSYRKKNLPGD